MFKSGGISEKVMLLTKWATPRVCVLCRTNSCDHCPRLVTADGLTWTWGSQSQCIAWVTEAAAVPKTCCQAGQVHVPLLFVSCWAEHRRIFLSFQSCGRQLWAHNPCPQWDLYGEWWDRRGCFQLKWFELHLSTLVWLAHLGFERFGVRIWHMLKV